MSHKLDPRADLSKIEPVIRANMLALALAAKRRGSTANDFAEQKCTEWQRQANRDIKEARADKVIVLGNLRAALGVLSEICLAVFGERVTIQLDKEVLQ